MRIAIASISLESNTFNPVPVTLDDFRAVHLLEGDDVFKLSGSHHEVGGFLSECDSQPDVEIIPLLAAAAGPGGHVMATAYEQMLTEIVDRLTSVGSVDGVYLAPHGAMVAEHIDDADGHWMARVRELVGTDIPLIATCDPHANVSELMVRSTDALLAYQTNPHLDQYAKGQEAARLMIGAVLGRIRPVQSACFPPLSIGIERQSTSEPPCSELIGAAGKMRQEQGLLATSVILGFPYADVPEIGSSAIVITNNDRELAAAKSWELGRQMWERRHGLVGQLVSIEQALREVAAADGPVCLLDMGDNVGGGSPGDGTAILHELQRQKLGPSLAVLHDPESVRRVSSAGMGTVCHLSIGGKSSSEYGPPVVGEFEVVAKTDGVFTEPQIRHGGMTKYDQGSTVVVRNQSLTVMLTSRRMAPFSLNQILHAGLDPCAFRAIIAKGVHAPLAAYGDVCGQMIRVDTPGITAANLLSLRLTNRRHPMFPFEADATWGG